MYKKYCTIFIPGVLITSRIISISLSLLLASKATVSTPVDGSEKTDIYKTLDTHDFLIYRIFQQLP